MKRSSFLCCILLISLVSCQGFVSVVDLAGRYRKWELTKTVSDISTNVVNPKTKAIRYFLSAYSETNRQQELNAVRAAFGQWQAIPGTILKFEEGGQAPAGIDVDTYDGTNAVFWAYSTAADGRVMVRDGQDDLTGVLSYTYLDYFTDDNTIAEVDIVFNGNFMFGGRSYTWSADPNPGSQQISIELVALHEIGHMIGLEHSPLGGAMMLSVVEESGEGLARLSSDEWVGARALYPLATYAASLGKIRGKLSLSGRGAFGAVVLAENSSGNVISSTLSRSDGNYELAALPPETYQVRVAPLDAPSPNRLIQGKDISDDFLNVDTDFTPSNPSSLTLSSGQTQTLNFTLTPGRTPFHIIRTLPPGARPTKGPISLMPGQSGIIGVGSYDLPTDLTSFSVPGGGLIIGSTLFSPDIYGGSGFNVISVSVEVLPSATPGMRSLILQKDNITSYANGFLIIPPIVPDYNFDQLDDRFQRQYFSPWTSSQAASNADPDNDGATNLDEYNANTNPMDSTSWKIFSISKISTGYKLEWPSVIGRKYVVEGYSSGTNSEWQTLTQPISATGKRSQWIDGIGKNIYRWYRIRGD